MVYHSWNVYSIPFSKVPTQRTISYQLTTHCIRSSLYYDYSPYQLRTMWSSVILMTHTTMWLDPIHNYYWFILTVTNYTIPATHRLCSVPYPETYDYRPCVKTSVLTICILKLYLLPDLLNGSCIWISNADTTLRHTMSTAVAHILVFI